MGNDKVKEINVVYITDQNYFANTCISIYSIKKNRNLQIDYQIYIILDQMSEKEADILYRLETDNFYIHILESNINLECFYLMDFPVSNSACIKFHLTEILPKLEKVLYLDGDMIVQSDLTNLYNTDVEMVYAAVVRDLIAENMIPSAMDKLKSGLQHYFNSGMMLLNLCRLREDGIKAKLMDYRLNGINYFMDQDALNVVFGKNVKFIPSKYNYMITLHEQETDITFPDEYGYDNTLLEWERMHMADIIHLTGRVKPWKEYVLYATDLFMDYYCSSPWKNDFRFLLNVKINGPQSMTEKYIFPFAHVPKNSRIVIWGAGKVGQVFYHQIQATEFCFITAVIDECAEQYNQDEKTWKNVNRVLVPEMVQHLDYDYVVIAVKREQIAMDISDSLKQYGIAEDKIVWKYPVYG